MVRGRLIVGLGNPGTSFEATRHNVGFEVVKVVAKRHGWKFHRGFRLKGEVAVGMMNEDEIICLLPTAYMNRSGEVVNKALGRHRIAFSDRDVFLVVVDDVYLKTGTMRLRAEGSAGGHNGLKSVEAGLSSTEYARLRIGVGPRHWEAVDAMGMEKFVLAPFATDERAVILEVIEKGADVIECWLQKGIEKARQMAGETKVDFLDDQTSQEN